MQKPHAVCLPCPAQGHITPMLYLAKLLHAKGFHITFVNTEFNHRRLINSGAIDPKVEIEGFHFEAIPEGLPRPSNDNASQDVVQLVKSLMADMMLDPFKQLMSTLNGNPQRGPPVTCIVKDAFMIFTQSVAAELGIPEVPLWTLAGCSFMGLLHYEELIQRGYTPFKDESCFTNGYLNTRIDWIPAMPDIRLKDLPTFIRTVDPDDTLLNFFRQSTQKSLSSSAHVIDTFEALDREILDAAERKFQVPRPYAVGPLFALCEQISDGRLNSIQSNLWKEEKECMEWLDNKDDRSVIYMNFGSVAVLTQEQLKEFAWGLANSNYPFLWVVRPDLVSGRSAVLEQQFLDEIKDRGAIASWCPQKQVLAHPSVGGFLTHCGWNSMSEGIFHGVPMLCWPYFGDQQPNCRHACSVWGVGIEIDHEVTREKVERAIKELMEGNKGMEVRKNVVKWQEEARKAILVGGSSHGSFDRLVNNLLGMKCN